MEVIILFQYTIQPGDTIYSIASQFNVSLEAILYANPGSNPNRLIVGQIILIPTNYYTNYPDYPRYPVYPRYNVLPILPIPFWRFQGRGFFPGRPGRGGMHGSPGRRR